MWLPCWMNASWGKTFHPSTPPPLPEGGPRAEERPRQHINNVALHNFTRQLLYSPDGNFRTGKSRLLAISLAAVFIILSSSSGSIVRNCLDRSSVTGVAGKSKRPSKEEEGLPSVSLASKSNMAVRLGDSGKPVKRARPRAASKSERSASEKKRFSISR